MYSGADIEAVMTLNDSEYRKKLKDAPGAAKSALSSIAGLAAGYLSFRAGVAMVKDTITAFTVQEDAVNRVRAALRKQGEEYNLQTQALEKYAGELQNVTTYGDEGTLAAMAQGLNMGIAADKIKEATKAAMGLAAAYNMDLNTAMVLVAKANAGNTAALSKWGIEIDASKSKQEQFNEVLKKGAEAFQLAEANAKTTGGRLKSLAGAWGDLKEVIGEFIVELFNVRDDTGKTINQIGAVIDYIKKHMAESVFSLQSVWIDLEAGLRGVWALIEPVATYIVQKVSTTGENIVTIAKWVFQNIEILINHAGDIFASVLRDRFLGPLKFIQKHPGDLIGAALDYLENGSDWDNTNDTLSKIGANFPELKSADFSSVEQKYRNLSNTFAQIEEERLKRQKQLEDKYREDDEARRKKQQDNNAKKSVSEENGKSNVLGSFSAAILQGLLGADRPEKETAKNTKELVRIAHEKKGGGGTLILT